MPSKSKNINELIDDTFMDKNKFSMTIENIVKDSNRTLSYIDAIVLFCENNNIEFDSVPKLISKPLKEKIKYEAMELNFLKRTSRAKLPL